MVQSNEYQNSKYISFKEILSKYDIKKIDFLKCDIEGAEFELFEQIKPYLSIVDKIAIEVHDFAGDRFRFRQMLIVEGYQIENEIHNPNDCILLAKKT